MWPALCAKDFPFFSSSWLSSPHPRPARLSASPSCCLARVLAFIFIFVFFPPAAEHEQVFVAFVCLFLAFFSWYLFYFSPASIFLWGCSKPGNLRCHVRFFYFFPRRQQLCFSDCGFSWRYLQIKAYLLHLKIANCINMAKHFKILWNQRWNILFAVEYHKLKHTYGHRTHAHTRDSSAVFALSGTLSRSTQTH